LRTKRQIMNLTQEQIKETLLEIANEKDGINVIMKMSLEVLMKSERKMFQEDTGVSANGFRPRRIQGFGKEIALSVPRTRTGEFYPVLLSVIRAENEEHQKLICNLYTKGLTTEQISEVYSKCIRLLFCQHPNLHHFFALVLRCDNQILDLCKVNLPLLFLPFLDE
jgi:transposase-like protein